MAESKVDFPTGAGVRVLVTGAAGFIASHVIQQLLELGYSVRGTVRSLKDEAKYAHLKQFKNAENLELVEADLLAAGSFDKAVEDCTYVQHVASPYKMNVKDPQKELVDPALKGTLTVLESVAKYNKAGGKILRVVLTSSCAAIMDEPISDHIYTEADWNEKSSVDRNPYFYSKVVAEKAAWKFCQENNIDLVVINPCAVIGPSFTADKNPSIAGNINGMFDGSIPVLVALMPSYVDVRDTARAHVVAMVKKEANGRYVCVNVGQKMTETAAILRKHFPKYGIPTTDLSGGFGNCIAKMSSCFQPGQTGQYIRTHIGRTLVYDNSKIKKDLGIEFIPIEQSLVDTVNDQMKWGHIKKKE